MGWRAWVLAYLAESHADRLGKIARLHYAEGGAGLCQECSHEWPCPTRDLANWEGNDDP